MPPPDPGDLPDHLALFPLPGVVVLPRDRFVIQAFERRYTRMIDDVLGSHRLFGIVQPREDGTAPEHPIPDDWPLYGIGGAAYIQAFHETGDARYLLQLTGVSRFRINSDLLGPRGYRRATVDWSGFDGDFEPADGSNIDHDSLLRALQRHARFEQMEIDWDDVADYSTVELLHFGVRSCRVENREKQGMLEAGDAEKRAEMLFAALAMKEAERTGPGTGSIN